MKPFKPPFSPSDRREPFAGLTELSLRWFPMTGLVLKAPKLRALEIIESHQIQEISAPLLTSFRYEGYLPLECSRMNVPMLEQVYLDIHGLAYNPEWLHLNCVRLLHQLGNATSVSLTLKTLKLLEPPQSDFLERFISQPSNVSR
ncbi:hypothetical protein SASPL_148110 [Salvia splendens]|uniref:Uncharacterized protein n=1 Tax=Salvia splendens TaxID=180675 RepID=A0A8X8WA64_SALSN|nr:hypothetical protein SASPL_148110 [Salvia splendens]